MFFTDIFGEKHDRFLAGSASVLDQRFALFTVAMENSSTFKIFNQGDDLSLTYVLSCTRDVCGCYNTTL